MSLLRRRNQPTPTREANMPSETLSAPTTEPETPSLFDPAQCARAWLQAAADTDGMLPWAWTPSIGRELRITNTATVVTAPDAGQWWTRDGDTWQPTNTGQIRAALDTWGIAHARFDEHPGRADATSRHAFQWLRAHATHGHADAGPEQYGRPPTSWAQRGADGQLPDDARGCAQAFISERHYPPAPQGGRRLGYWNGAFHRSGPAGWTTVSDHDLIEQIRGWLNGARLDANLIEELRVLCHYPVAWQLPTPLDLADHDQHRAAQQAAKTLVPQPIGAPA